MAKPKSQLVIHATRGKVTLPGYIQRAHRHLEKGQFNPLNTNADAHIKLYRIPTDILALTLTEKCIKPVKEVILGYRQKSLKQQ
jgi:hypothetical protein